MPSSSADAEQVAGEESLLDLAALRRCVAGPVRGEARAIADAVGGELVDQLGGAAALGEHEGPELALYEVGHQL